MSQRVFSTVSQLVAKQGVLIAGVFAAASLSYLIFSAFLTTTNANLRFGDFRFIYNAGVVMAHGESPYKIQTYNLFWLNEIETLPDTERPYSTLEGKATHPSELSNRALMYPFLPNSGWLAIPLSAAGWRGAKLLISVVNIGAVLALAFTLYKRYVLSRTAGFLLLSLCCLASATSATASTGQLSLLSTLGSVLCFEAATSGRSRLAGAGAALALVKPQVSMLILLAALAKSTDRTKTALWCVLSFAASNLACMLLFADMEFLSDYESSIALRASAPFNLYRNMDGLYYILSPFLGRMAVSAVAGLAGVVATLVATRSLRSAFVMPCVALISLCCLPLHVGYDLVIVLPVCVLLFHAPPRHWDEFAWAILLALILRYPNVVNALSKLGFHPSRQLVLIVLLAAVIVGLVRLDLIRRDFRQSEVTVERV